MFAAPNKETIVRPDTYLHMVERMAICRDQAHAAGHEMGEIEWVHLSAPNEPFLRCTCTAAGCSTTLVVWPWCGASAATNYSLSEPCTRVFTEAEAVQDVS